MNGFSCDIETITPEVAKQWLERNVQNRPVSEAHCRSLAKDMKEGNWSVCGNTIVFSNHGDLIDGQHRLYAVVKSGCCIESPVMRGISDENAFSHIDQVKKRTAADVIATVGKDRSTTRAAATKLIYQMVKSPDMTHFRLSNQRIPNKAIFDFEQSLTEMNEAVESASIFSKYTVKSIVAATMVVLIRIDENLARKFFTRLREGIFQNQDDPLFRLRDALLMKPNPGLQKEVLVDMALIFKAWNLDLQGKTIKAMQWREEQRFPVPVGYEQAWRH